ncbi:NK-tumor recognition protein isoform X1 [Terrapene carolina triunguis]|uniref:peptidylprolyl isomerase n=3 Tax=Terrapene triunguis TaxID=2587831 RepID=A0A674IQ56_9SAUR|nr:NK-tumor recognition protein isoform X1 [Terrapene carolina triunguis]
MGAQDRPQCFFDIEINREPVGRIMFQLFSDVCPKTCKNFLCLCSGEKGIGKTTRKKLCYKGSTFHRVVKNFMIQGGDFSEGNGKGGESIYGGYFKDENFVLKHDRAFLLSMANRGKHTNGSQFFITTKPAPHLDGVHVVFGLVISGFEVIEQIENLKTDTASRPYADVRVIDCGVLVTKSAKNVLEKKRKASTHSEASDSSSSSSTSSESSSESEVENEKSRRRKRKRRTKIKQSRKRRREEKKKEEPRCKRISNQRGSHSDKSDVNERKSVDLSTKRDKPVVRPEEIPPVPENRFLLRRDVPVVKVESEPKLLDVAPVLTDQKPSVSKSGRKIKGRGTIRYHTPPRSRSCSESDDDESSETPPHWKEEMQRLRTYRPPSGEKWSKGDKLSDPCSSRWDDRSLSQRSRSWSHNGYSDLSTLRYTSHHKKHRKEKKKTKHKKKAKKQKHFKKHKQTKKKRTSPSSEVESSRSSIKRTKSSRDRERKSPSSSLSSRRSSRRDWSKSDKDDQSSSTLSSRDSHSYYRSRCRSRSRSRSRSYSRRSSRSRTASKLSHSRSRSRSSTNSRHHRTVSNSPRNTKAELNENKPNKTEPVRAAIPQSDKVVVQPVVAENIPVISLSDSPPPSRWKPGQKPWKPSYERIQEMKAKTTHLIPTQSNYNLTNIKEVNTSSSSSRKRQKSSDSDRSGYSRSHSERSSDSWLRSRSRSSRSRSYSRSYTRSRSPSSSRSRSRSTGRSQSPNRYRSDQSGYSGSSSYYSLSDDDRHGSKRKSESSEQNFQSLKKRQESSSESSTVVRKSKTYDESSQGRKESERRSSLDFSTDSEHSVKIQPVQEKEGHSQPEGDNQKENKNNLTADRSEEKSKSEWDSDHSKKKSLREKTSEQHRSGAKTKRKTYSGSKWDSESNSERGETRNGREDSRPSSSKEEGEATSGSDTELSLTKSRVKTKSNSSEGFLDSSDHTWKTSKQQSSSSASENSHSSLANIKGKSKKHKHGSKKNLKKSHSKKAKEKSKEKKEKKHKVQKQKELFHWQPPLEFGEEEDEDMNEKPVTRDDKKQKQLTRDSKDKNQQAYENNKMCKDKTGNGEKSCEDENLSSRNTTCNTSPEHSHLNKDNSEHNYSASTLNPEINVATSKKGVKHIEESKQNGSEDVMQTDDNMEICTPDRNSPGKVGVDILSPVILSAKSQTLNINANKDLQNENPGPDTAKQGNRIKQLINVKEVKKIEIQDSSSVTMVTTVENTLKTEITENTQSSMIDNKWKPLQGVGNLQSATTSSAAEVTNSTSAPDSKPQGLRIEIKSKNKVRPGSLFDEVRKTARLNRRPRNQESSSDEQSPPSRDDNSQSRSLSRSRSKSESKSRHRTRSLSYSHSRSRSRSSTYSYRSRSYTRSRSRGWYSRDRSRSRSRSYHSYKSHSRTYSRSRSRSSSYDHHSRSRSYTYDSYYSRSRSRSRSQRSDSYRRSRSYDRRSRSYGSDSESDRSYSNNRSPSESSRSS